MRWLVAFLCYTMNVVQETAEDLSQPEILQRRIGILTIWSVHRVAFRAFPAWCEHRRPSTVPPCHHDI